MKLSTETTTLFSTSFTAEERATLTNTVSMIEKIREMIPDCTYLESLQTGEIIEPRELNRTLGILTGFLSSTDWKSC